MSYEFPKDLVIECLKELSDEGFQRRVWLASSGPEISSFVEAICGLFNDTGLDIVLEKETFPMFSSEIDDGLRQLHQLTGRVAYTFQSMPPTEVIEHPKMQEIRCLAVKVLTQMERKEIA